MSTLVLAMMIGICGFVWGGFLVLLTRALRQERRKGATRAGGELEG
jgi:LPS O-antigen subunit length determinant protein (WzzB/FepE family)